MRTRHALCFVLLAAVVGRWAAPASAEALPVAGGSFESPVILDPPFETPFIPLMNIFGWTETGPTTTDPGSGFVGTLDTGVFYNFESLEIPDGSGGTTVIPNPEFVVDASGDQVGFIGAIPEPVTGEESVSAYQFLGAGTTYQEGVTYSLLVDVGKSGRPGFVPPNGSQLGLQFVYKNDLDEIAVVDSLALLAEDVKSNDLDEFVFEIGPVDSGDAFVGKEVGIRILPLSGVSGNWTFDNVRVNAVPEPTTGLMLAALGALSLKRRRV